MLAKSLTDCFEEVVKNSPDALALVCGEKSLTYFELNDQAERLAEHLREREVFPHSMIGIALERSNEFVIAVLGILKAGCTYVPLPIDYPDSRIQYMIEDGRLELLITDQSTAVKMPASNIKKVSMTPGEAWREKAVEYKKISIPSSNPAYVMYTSGTTGIPKGVVIPHRAVIHLITRQKYADFGPHMRTLLHSPTAFDASTFELWAPLLHGGTCIVSTPGYLETELFKRAIVKEQVNTLWLTGSVFNHIIDTDPNMLDSVAHVISGGEALSAKHIVKAYSLLPKVRLSNGYGPTETTTFSCVYPIPRSINAQEGSIPIGFPLHGTECYLVDENLRAVEPGAIGELLIGGKGLADGYLNKEELTEEKFIIHSGSRGDNKKFFRSGDLCRRKPDGGYEFFGRLDNQVKIRGTRIELGEIEAALRRHPSVMDVFCRPIIEEEITTGSTAHIKAEEDDQLEKKLRNYLKNLLPPGFIPTQFVFHKSFPLTSQGKVDRRILDQRATEQRSEAIFLKKEEKELKGFVMELWGELLPFDQNPEETDNFFDYGGDSLKALKMVYSLEKKIGKKIPLYDFYKEPTPSGIFRLAKNALSNELPVLTHLSTKSTGTPIVMVYNVAGDLSSKRYLVDLLKENNQIIGIRSPLLALKPYRYKSMEEAASLLIREIERSGSTGTPIIIGYSWGGLLAFEVGRQWQKLKNEIPFVVAIATECPFYITRRQRIANYIKRFPKWIFVRTTDPKKWVFHYKKFFTSAESAESAESVSNKEIINYHIKLTNKYIPDRGAAFPIHYFRDMLAYENSQQSRSTPNDHRGVSHQDHPNYPQYSRHDNLAHDGGWEDFTGIAPIIHPIMADHEKILTPPFINQITAEILKALEESKKNCSA